jgi:hypothetical protein
MRTSSVLILVSLGAHFLHAAEARELAGCVALPLMTESLSPSECVCQDGLKAMRYQDAEPSSPYSTDFDRRKVAIVLSRDLRRVREAAGIAGLAGEKTTHLISPPVEEVIVKRSSEEIRSNYRDWRVSLESIEYGSQGGGAGFTFDCGTATLLKSGRSIAVAECFPVEERTRYFKLMDTISNAPLEFGASCESNARHGGE